MKFPKRIRYRGRVLATIYGKSKPYPFYRLACYVAGKRRVQSFSAYALAKAEADKLVRDLAKGSQAAALSARQSRDALAALERLEEFRLATGRRVSLLAGISQFCDAAGKLRCTVGEAVEGYLRTVASVSRKDIGEAVEEFVHGEAARTQSANGERPQLSPKYAYNREIYLRRFAGTFPNTALCDLSKQHLDAFFTALGKQPSKRRHRFVAASKTRNHHRAALKQFLEWAVRKDYLPPNHRLLEADTMRPERANTAEIEFYTPDEFRALLEAAEEPMRAMIAIGGLAGLRTQELLRLDWGDVWRVPGHIEVTAGKAKTRQRRLVEIVPALAAWLEAFRNSTGKVWPFEETCFHETFPKLCETADVKRKANGLRHAFVSHHFASHANENLTAALAGHAPAMVHQHYKGLATKAEAEKWFAVAPATPANVIPLVAATAE